MLQGKGEERNPEKYTNQYVDYGQVYNQARASSAKVFVSYKDNDSKKVDRYDDNWLRYEYSSFGHRAPKL